MCAAVFPMLALGKKPDPLYGTLWSTLTSSSSAVVPFLLGCIYACVAYFLLRIKRSAGDEKYILAGSAVGLIPCLFYTVVSPFATSHPPLLGLYAIGVIVGPIFGGGGFVLAKRDAEKQRNKLG